MDDIREIELEGSLKTYPNTEDVEINFSLENGLRIKSLCKSFLTSKISNIPTENGIYILEGHEVCYIGQSKNLSSRLRQHHDSDKINFIRCFILYHTDDIRGYLDYMEAYTITKMKEQGYLLDNKTTPDPEEDRLSSLRKNKARHWVNDFLLFLQILGFRKSKQNTEIEVKDLKHIEKCFASIGKKTKYPSYGELDLDKKSFLVLKGSIGRFSTIKDETILQKQNKLKLENIIEEIDSDQKNLFKFVQDHNFHSVSAAAQCIYGYSINGWIFWKTKDNNPIEDIRIK